MDTQNVAAVTKSGRVSVVLWSILLTTIFLTVAATVVYFLIPQELAVRMSAHGLSEGSHDVTLRAVDPDSLEVLYSTDATATVRDGMLDTTITPSKNLQNTSYIIEVCTTSDGSTIEKCFTSSQAEDSKLVYSCPYYVSEQRSGRLANLLQQNSVEFDSSFGCYDSANSFGTQSIVETLKQVSSNGLAVQGTSLLGIDENGRLAAVDIEAIARLVEVDTDTEDQQSTTINNQTVVNSNVNNYYTVSQSADNQSLTLSGRQLTISGGNTITLPVDKDTTYALADGTTDGLISAADWSSFAAKENSLTFSNGLTRSGDTVSLMSCAAGEVLKNDGASWLCAQDIVGAPSTTYSAGTGISITGASNTISNTGLLSLSASGALTSSGGQNPGLTLSTTSDLTQLGNSLGLTDTGVTAGTYNNVTVDSKGRVTGGTNVSYLTSYTETDGVIGNEVAGVVNSGGLVMTGAGTTGDPYKVGLVTTCADGQLLKYTSANGWACANDIDTDTDTNTDQQTLSWNTGTNQLTISGGNSIDLSSLKDNTDSQAISLSGDILSISGNAATVDLNKYLDNTDTQDLSLTTTAGTGNVVNSYQVSLTDGGSVTFQDTDTDTNTTYSNGNGLSLTGTVFAIDAPTCTGTTAKLLWSGTSFTCGTDIDTDTNTTYTAGSGLSLSGTTFALDQQGATTGQVLKWNGSAWVPGADVDTDTDTNTTYAAGNGITISGASNDISINASTCSAGQYLTWNGSAFSCANDQDTDTDTDDQTLSYTAGTRTLQISEGNSVIFPLADGTTTSAGLLSQADYNTFNGKENVLSFSDGLTRTGDSVTLMDCAANQILQRNSGDSAWLCANQVVDTDTNTTYSAGTGISITGASNTISNTGLLSLSASGALTSSGGQNPGLTLSTTSDLTQLGNSLGLTDTGVTAGTYNNVTVDSKGRVTGGTNVSYLTSYTETDGVIGNEVAGVVNSGGLVMTGAGTTGDPYKVGLVTTCADGQLLKYTTAGGWACANDIDTDTDTNTDQQTLSWNTSTNQLTISGGNSIDLSSLKDNTDSQAISLSGDILSISGNAATVDLNKYLDNTDTQDLSLTTTAGTGNVVNSYQVSLTDGGSVTFQDTDTDTNTTYSNGNGLSLTGTVFAIDAPTCTGTTAKLLWSGTSFTCGTDIDTDTNTTYTAGSGLSLSGTTFALDQQGATTGQVLKWNGSAWVPAADIDTTYSASTGITITSGAIAATLGTDITSSEIVDGTIAAADLAASGATAGTYGDSGVNVAQVTVNAQGQITAVSNRALPSASSTTTGVLSSTDWNTFNGKENVLTFTGNGLFSRTGNTITGLTCSTIGQVVAWNGTAFNCQTVSVVGGGVTSVNSLNGALTLNTGTSGTDFNVTSSGSTITYNLPSASTTARGAVTTGTQTFGGAKTFNVGGAAVGFQVTDGTLPHFTIDTTNKRVSIGSSAPDTNAISLVLDSYSTAADPTGVNGSMYYNSSLGKFRCYENGVWKDCIGGVAQVRTFVDTTTNSSLVDANTTSYWALATFPNITPSATTRSVEGLVTVDLQQINANTSDHSIMMRVERTIGGSGPAACGSGTSMGILGIFTTNSNERGIANLHFVDDTLNTTSTVYYNLCSDTATITNTNMRLNSVRFTLEEVNKTN